MNDRLPHTSLSALGASASSISPRSRSRPASASRPASELSSEHSKAVHIPSGWGAGGMGDDTQRHPHNHASPRSGSAANAVATEAEMMAARAGSQLDLAIKDLDSGRTIPFEQADMLWQPLLVRDLDANILLPFAPVEGRSTAAEEMLNPPPEQMRFMTCSLERNTTPAPLSLPE